HQAWTPDAAGARPRGDHGGGFSRQRGAPAGAVSDAGLPRVRRRWPLPDARAATRGERCHCRLPAGPGPASVSEGRSWAGRLGLGTPEVRAWALYDWANSAFITTIVAAIFPIYYNSVAAAGLAPDVSAFRFSIAT